MDNVKSKRPINLQEYNSLQGVIMRFLKRVMLYGLLSIGLSFLSFSAVHALSTQEDKYGYLWQSSDDGQLFLFKEAEQYCASLTLDGYTDWTLPSVTDWRGILNDLKDYYRAINTYQEVIFKYKGTNYEPMSKFMIGFIYANVLDDLPKAESTYSEFIKEFPEHELVPSVKFELDYLGKQIKDIEDLKAKDN